MVESDSDDTEYELVDTGIFDDDRYRAVTVDYAKASPTDLCVLITVANRGDTDETLHVLRPMLDRTVPYPAAT